MAAIDGDFESQLAGVDDLYEQVRVERARRLAAEKVAVDRQRQVEQLEAEVELLKRAPTPY